MKASSLVLGPSGSRNAVTISDDESRLPVFVSGCGEKVIHATTARCASPHQCDRTSALRQSQCDGMGGSSFVVQAVSWRICKLTLLHRCVWLDL